MFKLAHISDVHLGPLPPITTRELLSKRLTGYLNFKKNRSKGTGQDITSALVEYHNALKLDHTVITGDLINLGLTAEIENVKNWLQKNFKPFDTTLICGNHDAYLGNSLALALQAWQPWLQGDDAKHVLSNEGFPGLRKRGNISIISCNSAVPTGLFNATGAFTNEQGERLKSILKTEGDAGQCRVIIIHHPPFPNATHNHKRLIGFEHFMDAVKQSGAELVLHGHTHLETINHIDGDKNRVPVVCVPAAYQWLGQKKPPSALNLFQITGSKKQWNIKLERHSLQPSGVYEPKPLIDLNIKLF